MSEPNLRPFDLKGHFSRSSQKRAPNVLKEYYRFLRVPDMRNLAGGLPFSANFPFENIELSVVRPESHLQENSEGLKLGSAEDFTNKLHIPRTVQGSNSVRRVDLDTALQYGSAQGYPPLYAWLRKLVNTVYHPNIPYEGQADVMINGGAADGLSKVFELLFNNWDADLNDVRDREGLLVEEFVYGPPIAQIKPKGINVVPIKMDAEGILAHGDGSLSHVLQTWNSALGKRPHVVYVIPTGQNPTSGVLSLKRRIELYEVCSQFDLVLIEDDPYWNLYYPSTLSTATKYRGRPMSADFPTDPDHNYCTGSLGGRSTGHRFLDQLVPSFLSIDRDGRVIRLDSFSKTIAPGCRLGWITAQPSVCEQLFRITDSTTQQPSGFVQAIVMQLLGDLETPSFAESTLNSNGKPAGWGLNGWVNWLEGLRSTYERRMNAMATVLEENRYVSSEHGQTEMFSFNWPMGGMFLWVRVHISNHPLISVDPRRLMLALWLHCTQQPYRILVVPGGDFAATKKIEDDHGYLFFRFCFAAVEESALVASSMSFAEACRSFWDIQDMEVIEKILQENADEGEDEFDREIIED
ncbi:uncharacterized protein N7487_002840 [Penicillium crustosum]|uniref:uncharacterized protein n=1 Tax=Penicillium crustosum TaxID=36656 RepID=UPI0023822AB4|nr:uncharacterized protein N7487_002840 [Penicillium crustosum]KAJ5419290.1 hypothetical protein N7487_002840 [Penicillium crustosum]